MYTLTVTPPPAATEELTATTHHGPCRASHQQPSSKPTGGIPAALTVTFLTAGWLVCMKCSTGGAVGVAAAPPGAGSRVTAMTIAWLSVSYVRDCDTLTNRPPWRTRPEHGKRPLCSRFL